MLPGLTTPPPLKFAGRIGRSDPCTALGLPPLLRRRLSVVPSSNRPSTASSIPHCFWKEVGDVVSRAEKEFGSMEKQRDVVELSKNPKNLSLWLKVFLGIAFSWAAHNRNVYKMTNKRSVGDLKESDLNGRKAFVRVDFDIALDDSFNITDDTKIRAAVPTIKFLMGCPKGVSSEYSLRPLVPRLSQLLGVEVKMANDCIGKEVDEMVAQLSNGGVLLLENVRFYEEEEKNDPEFAKKLASLADVYVNDAFGAAHRAHASTEGLTKFLRPSVAGFQMQKELDYLVQGETIPKKPFAAIVGGNDLSTKYHVIDFLLSHVDVLLLGGGMIYTFYKAQGNSIELFLVEEDKIHLATSLIKKAKAKGVSLLLPTDVVVGEMLAVEATKVLPALDIPDGFMVLDLGPDSIKSYSEALEKTRTILWNGHLGVFATETVANEAIASKLAELNDHGVKTIIVGDESIAAVKNLGLADKMSHISPEDGASLMVLEGKCLPGVIALEIG